MKVKTKWKWQHDASHKGAGGKGGKQTFSEGLTRACCFVTLLGTASQAIAVPKGGQVTGGQGTIAYGNTTTVNQNTASLAIDWQSFNVDANEAVRFVQPTSSSVVLNRILDQNPSQIFGSIDANGRVFLSNPNGLIFGDSATINAGSFVASGLDINTADFMAGNYSFGTIGTDGGAVINRGLIEAATGGSVSLVGSSVQNDGVIVADYGTVNLGAGQTAVLDFDGDGLIRFEVDGAVLNNALGVTSAVDNQGVISANGGEVLLTADAAQDVFSRVVNNDGLIEAGRIDNSGGIVRLIGLGEGEVINSGTIDASGQDAVSTGGTIHILGEKVGLFGTATVDASGPAGGGEVLIGGDREGANPDIRNATGIYIGAETAVHADALVNGDGGKVIAYAGEAARIYGEVSARGGAEGGNGGFIETSGKLYLNVTQAPDISAPVGKGGEWLIDPSNLEIVSSGSNTNYTEDPLGTFTSNANTSKLDVQLITDALKLGDVTVQTGAGTQDGDITVSTSIIYSDVAGGNATLTLHAHDGITFGNNNDIARSAADSLDSALSVYLIADGLSSGGITLNSGADIKTNGGSVTATGISFNNDNSNCDITTAGGNVTITTTNNTALRDINASTGTIRITAGGTISNSTTPLTANEIDLIAGTGIGTGEATPVYTATANLSALTTTSGAVYVQNTGAVNVDTTGTSGGTTYNSTAGGFYLKNDNGQLTVDATNNLEAVGTVKLSTTTAGNIVLSGTTTATGAGSTVSMDSFGTITGTDTVTANSVDLIADTGIGTSEASPVNTATTYLSALTRTSGAVYVHNTGAVNVDTTGTHGVTSYASTAGSFNLVNDSGSLTVDATNNLGAVGAIKLRTTTTGNIVLSGTTTATGGGNSVTMDAIGSITGAATVTANEIDLIAGTGGIGADGNPVNTHTSNLSALTIGSGDVYVSNTGTVTINTAAISGGTTYTSTAGGFNLVNDAALTIGNLGLNATGSVTMETTSGGIVLSGNTTGTSAVSLDSANTITGGGIVTADTVDLIAANGIGTSAASPVNTSTSNLSALTTTSGPVYVHNTGAVNVDTTGTSGGSTYANTAGSFYLVNDNGSLTVDATNNLGAVGAVTLATTTSGNIVLSGTTTATGAGSTVIMNSIGNINGTDTITADTVDLVAATGIGAGGSRVNTDTSNLSALTTTSGDVYVSNTGAVSVDTNSDGYTSTAGNFNLLNDAALTIGAGNLNATGSVTLATTSGGIVLTGTTTGTSAVSVDSADTINGAGTVTADTVDLIAVSGIGTSVASPVYTDTGNLTALTTSSGDVYVNNTGAMTVNTNVTIGGNTYTSTLGSINLVNDAALIIGSSNLEAGGSVTLETTSGGIVLNGTTTGSSAVSMDSAITITGAGMVTADTVDLIAATGIGSSTTSPVYTDTANLSALTTDSGDVFVSNTGAVTVDTTSGGYTGTAGGFNLLNDAAMTIGADNLNATGSVNLTTTSGGILLTGTTTGTSAVSLDSADTITGAGLITADVTDLIATTGIGTSAASPVYTDTGNLTALTTSSGDVFVSNTGAATVNTNVTIGGNTYTSTAGSFNLVNDAAITIGTTNLNAADSVILASTTDAINGTTGTITADSVDLIAATGIGTGTTSPVYTATSDLSALTTSSGDVYLSNTGAATVDTTSGGNIETVAGFYLVNDGELTVGTNGVKTNSGNIDISTTLGNGITVNGNVTAGTGSTLSLDGTGITLDSKVKVSTTDGTITVDANTGTLDFTTSTTSSTDYTWAWCTLPGCATTTTYTYYYAELSSDTGNIDITADGFNSPKATGDTTADDVIITNAAVSIASSSLDWSVGMGTTNGALSLSAVELSQISAPSLTVTSTGDMNVGSANLTGTSLTLVSGGNMQGIDTLTSTVITADDFVLTSNGSIGTTNAVDLKLVDPSTGTVSATANGDIVLRSPTNLTVGNIDATDTNGTVHDVYLIATDTNGLITQAVDGSVTANMLNTSSNKGTDLSGANSVEIFNATNYSNTGDIVLNNDSANGTLTITGITQAAGANITVTETDAIEVSGVTVSALSGTGGEVILTAGGAITDIQSATGSDDLNVDISSRKLTLNNATGSTTGIGVSTTNALNLSVSELDAATTGTAYITNNGTMILSGNGIQASNVYLGASAIGLGATPSSVSGALNISDAELDKIQSTSLNFFTAGEIIVDGVSVTDKNITLGAIDDRASTISFKGSSSSFGSLASYASGQILIDVLISTQVGGGNLELDGGSLVFGTNNQIATANLKSGKDLRLAASSPEGLVLGATNVTLDTSLANGSIDLGDIRITSGGTTTNNYSLSLIAGSGDIILGDIGYTGDSSLLSEGDGAALYSLTTSNSGTLYLEGDIFVKGGGINFSDAGQIVLKDNVKLNSVLGNGSINLGSTAPLYSLSSNSGGPFDLNIESGAGAVTLANIGQTTSNSPIGETWGPLGSLTVDGGPTTLYGNITAIDTIDLVNTSEINLAADVTMASSQVNLGTTTSAANGLTVTGVAGSTASLWLNGGINTEGNIDLSGVEYTALGENVVLATRGTLKLSGYVDGNVSGALPSSLAIDAKSGVILTGDVDIVATNVDFAPGGGLVGTTINGGGSNGYLNITTLDSSGIVKLYNIGDTNPIKWLSVSNAGSLTLVGSGIKTNTSQGVNLADIASINLASDITVDTTSGNGSVDLSGSTVTGSHSVLIQSGSGSVELGNFDGITTISVISDGNTTLWDSYIRTTYETGMIFTGAKQVYIEGDVVMDASGTSANILLDTTLDGAGGLTVNTGTPGVTLGAVGETVPLKYLIINGVGISTFNGNINTTGNIDLQNAGNVVLTSDITFNSSAGDINLTGGLVDGTNDNGSYQLALVASNGNVYLADVGTTLDSRVASLSVVTGGTAYLSGDIGTNGTGGIDFSQAANVYLQTDVTMNTADGNGSVVLDGSAVDGAQNLAINAGSGAVTLGDMGLSEALSSLSVITDGELLLNGDVFATNDVQVTGSAITMDINALTQSNSGNVTYTATTGDVKLGEISAVSGDVTVKANTGDIVNNRYSTDPSALLVNVTSKTLTLDAADKVGVSTIDPITIDVTDQITLGFGADTAYVRNIHGTAIVVTRGENVLDVFQSSRVAANKSIANGQADSDEEEDDDDEKEEKETDIITWLDNTRSPDVPRMIHTKKGWLFTRANEIVLPEVEVKPKKQQKESGSWTRDMFKF